MIYQFNNFIPVIHESSFIHPDATVTGNVIIGKDCYIGPGAAIRGDWGQIIIEDGCNVQENCTIHMFPGVTVLLKEGAHIGHGAIVHGATIGKNCLVGMNAVIMDNVILADEGVHLAIANYECVVWGHNVREPDVFHNFYGNRATLLRDLAHIANENKTYNIHIVRDTNDHAIALDNASV